MVSVTSLSASSFGTEADTISFQNSKYNTDTIHNFTAATFSLK